MNVVENLHNLLSECSLSYNYHVSGFSGSTVNNMRGNLSVEEQKEILHKILYYQQYERWFRNEQKIVTILRRRLRLHRNRWLNRDNLDSFGV